MSDFILGILLLGVLLSHVLLGVVLFGFVQVRIVLSVVMRVVLQCVVLLNVEAPCRDALNIFHLTKACPRDISLILCALR
jgi:hypothetical protein